MRKQTIRIVRILASFVARATTVPSRAQGPRPRVNNALGRPEQNEPAQGCLFRRERARATWRNNMAIIANRYRTLFLLLVAAAISYAVGFTVGFWFLIAVGAAFELAFWFELLFGRRRRQSLERQ